MYGGADRSRIRGFAFQARRFNNSASPLLANDFSKANLNGIHMGHKDRLYRFPCANCRCLLPWFLIPIGATEYDADLEALCPGKVE